MIGLTPCLMRKFLYEVADMEPGTFWARLHPDVDHIRFHAFRRRDGSWHLKLEALDNAEDEWSDVQQWGSVLDHFVWNEAFKFWDAQSLVERVLPAGATCEEFRSAMMYLFDLACTEELEFTHEGSRLLNWVWGQTYQEAA